MRVVSKGITKLHGQLSQIIAEIQSQGQKLADSNIEFNKEFGEIVDGITNINNAVDEISQGSTSQAQETTSASHSVNDIGLAIESNIGRPILAPKMPISAPTEESASER